MVIDLDDWAPGNTCAEQVDQKCVATAPWDAAQIKDTCPGELLVFQFHKRTAVERACPAAHPSRHYTFRAGPKMVPGLGGPPPPSPYWASKGLEDLVDFEW